MKEEEHVTNPTEPPGGGYDAPEGGYGQPGPGYGQPAGDSTALPAGVQVATMGQRLLAKLVDIAIGIVATVVVGLIFGGGSLMPEEAGQLSVNPGATLVTLLVWGAYEVTLIAQRGQTVGKQVVGIKVLREVDGAIPGWGPAGLRWLIQVVGYVLCLLPLFVVWLSPLFDKSGKQQGWHDKVARTVVIKSA
jgi:uncharacterized RDD family membrane protein YckC